LGKETEVAYKRRIVEGSKFASVYRIRDFRDKNWAELREKTGKEADERSGGDKSRRIRGESLKKRCDYAKERPDQHDLFPAKAVREVCDEKESGDCRQDRRHLLPRA
jgi:hypothetical protein